MHLTCTNLSEDKIKAALSEVSVGTPPLSTSLSASLQGITVSDRGPLVLQYPPSIPHVITMLTTRLTPPPINHILAWPTSYPPGPRGWHREHPGPAGRPPPRLHQLGEVRGTGTETTGRRWPRCRHEA